MNKGKLFCCFAGHTTPPLFVLRQRQSQAWIKEEGVVNDICYHTVSLNCNTFLGHSVVHQQISIIQLVAPAKRSHVSATIYFFNCSLK